MTENKNITYFGDNKSYQDKVLSLDTYTYCRMCIESQLKGCKNLLDIGNGGFFNYDISKVEQAVILDLCIDPSKDYGDNITPIQGDALNFNLDQKFDLIVLQMLIHHVTGSSTESALENIEKILLNCADHLAPGGRILVIESVVPEWFYFLEKIAFRILHRFWRFEHPLTLQHPGKKLIRTAQRMGLVVEEYTLIPRGSWLLQFGLIFPACLTPVQPVKLLISSPQSN